MLYYALVFLAVALISGIVGFAGVASAFAGLAQMLFLLFVALFVASLVIGSARRVL